MPIHHTVKTGNPMPVVQEGDLAVSLVADGGTEDVSQKMLSSLQSIDSSLNAIVKHLELITEEKFNGTD